MLAMSGKWDYFLMRISQFLFSVFFLFAPFFFTPLTFSGVIFDKWMLVYGITLTCFGVWLFRGILNGALVVRRSSVDFFIVLFLCIAALSAFFSVDVRTSVLGYLGDPSGGIVSFFALALFYFVFISSLKDMKEMSWYVTCLFISFGIVMVYSALQLFGIFLLPWSFTHTNSFNPVGGVLDLGILASLSIPFFVGFIGGRRGLVWVVFGMLFSLCALVILVSINALVLWVSVMIGTGLLSALVISRRVIFENTRFVFGLSLFFFIGAIFFLAVHGVGVGTIGGLPTIVNLSHQSSLEIVSKVLGERLWLGMGPSTFFYSFSKFRPLEINLGPLWDLRFDKASNLWFDMLGNLGIFGVIGFAALMCVGFLLFRRGARDLGKNFDMHYVGLSVTFFVFLLNTFLGVMNGGLVLIGFFCALLIAGYLFLENEGLSLKRQFSFRFDPQHSLVLSFFVVGGVAFFAFLFVFFVRIFVADIYMKRALIAPSFERAIVALDRAIAFAPWQTTYVANLAGAYLDFAAREAGGENADALRFQQASSLAIESARRVADMAPLDVHSWSRMGMLYRKLGAFVEGPYKLASASYERALVLEPNNPGFFVELARIARFEADLVNGGEEKNKFLNSAREFYEKALTLKPDYVEAYVGLAMLAEESGDSDDAVLYGERALGFAPRDTNIMLQLAGFYYNAALSRGGDLGLLRSAELVLNRVIVENPSSVDSYLLLGAVYVRSGDGEKGKMFHEKALSLVGEEERKSVEEKIRRLQR